MAETPHSTAWPAVRPAAAVFRARQAKRRNPHRHRSAASIASQPNRPAPTRAPYRNSQSSAHNPQYVRAWYYLRMRPRSTVVSSGFAVRRRSTAQRRFGAPTPDQAPSPKDDTTQPTPSVAAARKDLLALTRSVPNRPVSVDARRQGTPFGSTSNVPARARRGAEILTECISPVCHFHWMSLQGWLLSVPTRVFPAPICARVRKPKRVRIGMLETDSNTTILIVRPVGTITGFGGYRIEVVSPPGLIVKSTGGVGPMRLTGDRKRKCRLTIKSVAIKIATLYRVRRAVGLMAGRDEAVPSIVGVFFLHERQAKFVPCGLFQELSEPQRKPSHDCTGTTGAG